MSNPYPSCQGALALYEVTAIYSSMSRTQVLYNDFFALIYKDCMSKLLSYCAQIHPFSKLRDFFGQEVKILTMPSTQKGTAKVQPSKGVRINRIDYWSDEFYTVENQDVPIRYDPFNYGIAYAYANNRWIKCISNYYTRFEGYSEKAVKIATTLIHRKKQLHNQRVYANVSEIVNLLKNAEEYEELQLQLQRDRSSQKVRNLIETKPIVVDKSNVNKQQHNGAIANSEKHLETVRDFEPDTITESEFLENETDETNEDLGTILAYNDDELW